MLTPPAALEALLFVSAGPVSRETLQSQLSLTEKEFELAVTALEKSLTGHGLMLVVTPDELELRTAPNVAPFIEKMRANELSRDLGKASLETLAVIAYQHAVTRSEIDWIRGVNSAASVRTLLMRGLIEGVEDPKDKRRIRYQLTTEAYAHLGVGGPEELPRYNELRATPLPGEEGSDIPQ